MHAHTIQPGQFEDLNGNRAIGIWLSQAVTARAGDQRLQERDHADLGRSLNRVLSLHSLEQESKTRPLAELQ